MQEKSGRNISGDGVSHISLRVSHGRVILVGLFLLIIPFVPASNLFFPVGFVVAERILYLPSMGLCLIVGYAAYKMATSKHRLLSTCTKIGFVWLILTYSTKTMSRNRDWYSKLSLYSSFLKYSPDNAHMLVNAAKEFRNTGDFQRAELAYRHAMTVAPDLPSSYVNFGSMLNNLQRYQQAEEVAIILWSRSMAVASYCMYNDERVIKLMAIMHTMADDMVMPNLVLGNCSIIPMLRYCCHCAH